MSRTKVVIVTVLVAFATFPFWLWVGARLARSSPQPCTHGLSSIGPMSINGGKPTGNTKPSTEKCLP